MTSYYPIFLNLEGRNVLVVGGGRVAQRKIETLRECGALVRVVSHALTPELEKWRADGRIKHLATEFQESHLQGMTLVMAATDDAELNHRVCVAARAGGVLINAADQPQDCDFILPSLLKQGDLLIAISTAGKSPALAKMIRKSLEQQFGVEYTLLLNLMGQIRATILRNGLTQAENQTIFEELVQSSLLQDLKEEKWEQAAAIINRIIPLHWSSDEIKHYAGCSD